MVAGQNQYNKISVKVPVPVPMNEQGFPLSNAIRCHITSNLHNGSTWSECDETAWGLTRNCPNDRGEALCVSAVDMVKHTIAKGCMTRDALGVLELISPSQADVCRVSKKYPTQLYCTCSEDNCNSEMLLMERQCYHCRDCGTKMGRLQFCFSPYVLSKGISGAGEVYCVKETDYSKGGQVNRYCEAVDEQPEMGCFYQGSSLKCYCPDDACNGAERHVAVNFAILLSALLLAIASF
jgi:hypothetical protein